MKNTIGWLNNPLIPKSIRLLLLSLFVSHVLVDTLSAQNPNAKAFSSSEIAEIIAPGNENIEKIITNLIKYSGNPTIIVHRAHEPGQRSHYLPATNAINLYPAGYPQRLIDHLIAELSHAAERHTYRYQDGPDLESHDRLIFDNRHDDMPDLERQPHTVRLMNPDGTPTQSISTKDSTLIVEQEFAKFLTREEKQQRGYHPTDIIITRPSYQALADSLNSRLGTTYTSEQIADRMKYQSDQVDVGGDPHRRRQHHEEYITHAITERAIRERYNEKLRNTLPADQVAQYLLPIYPYNPPTGPSDGSQQGEPSMNKRVGREKINPSTGNNVLVNPTLEIDIFLNTIIMNIANTLNPSNNEIKKIILASKEIKDNMVQIGMDTTNKETLPTIWLSVSMMDSLIKYALYNKIKTMTDNKEDISGFILETFLGKELWKLSDRGYLIDNVGYHQAAILKIIGESDDQEIIAIIQGFFDTYEYKPGNNTASALMNFLNNTDNATIKSIIANHNKEYRKQMTQEQSGTISNFFPPNTRQDIFWDRVEDTDNATTQSLKQMITSYTQRTPGEKKKFAALMKTLFKDFFQDCHENNIDGRIIAPIHPTMTVEQMHADIQTKITKIVADGIADISTTGEERNTIYIDYDDIKDIVTTHQVYIPHIEKTIYEYLLRIIGEETKHMTLKPSIGFLTMKKEEQQIVFTEDQIPQLIALGLPYTTLALTFTKNGSSDSFRQLQTLLSNQTQLYELSLTIKNNEHVGDLQRLEPILKQFSKESESSISLSLPSFTSGQANYIINNMKYHSKSEIILHSQTPVTVDLSIGGDRENHVNDLYFENIVIDFTKHKWTLSRDLSLDMMSNRYTKIQGEALGRILCYPNYYKATDKPTHIITLNNHSHQDIDMILGFINTFNHANGSDIRFVLPSGLSKEDIKKLVAEIQKQITMKTSSYNVYIGKGDYPYYTLFKDNSILDNSILDNTKYTYIQSTDGKRRVMIQK